MNNLYPALHVSSVLPHNSIRKHHGPWISPPGSQIDLDRVNNRGFVSFPIVSFI